MLFWFFSLLLAWLLSFMSSLFWACLVLVASALLVSMNILQMGLNWLMYTLILLYVGGMMVLFIYMCSLTSNSKIELSGLGPILMFLLAFSVLYKMLSFSSFSAPGSSISSLFSLFSSGSEGTLMFLSVYLILGLLVSVVLMEKFQGPLKSLKDE